MLEQVSQALSQNGLSPNGYGLKRVVLSRLRHARGAQQDDGKTSSLKHREVLCASTSHVSSMPDARARRQINKSRDAQDMDTVTCHTDPRRLGIQLEQSCSPQTSQSLSLSHH